MGCFAVCCPNAHIGAHLAAGNVYHFAGNRADNNEAGFSIGGGATCEIPPLSWCSVVLVDLDVRTIGGTSRVNVKCFSRVLRGNGVLSAAVFVGPFRLDYEALSARGVIFPALDVRSIVASACGNIKHGAVFGFNDVRAVFNGNIRKALVGLVAFIGGGAWLRIGLRIGIGAACRVRACTFGLAVCAVRSARSTRSGVFSRRAARARAAFCGGSCSDGSTSRCVVIGRCAGSSRSRAHAGCWGCGAVFAAPILGRGCSCVIRCALRCALRVRVPQFGSAALLRARSCRLVGQRNSFNRRCVGAFICVGLRRSEGHTLKGNGKGNRAESQPRLSYPGKCSAWRR